LLFSIRSSPFIGPWILFTYEGSEEEVSREKELGWDGIMNAYEGWKVRPSPSSNSKKNWENDSVVIFFVS
jgi:hypothetical protein